MVGTSPTMTEGADPVEERSQRRGCSGNSSFETS